MSTSNFARHPLGLSLPHPGCSFATSPLYGLYAFLLFLGLNHILCQETDIK
jgi:hypothetical protein